MGVEGGRLLQRVTEQRLGATRGDYTWRVVRHGHERYRAVIYIPPRLPLLYWMQRLFVADCPV